MRSILITGVSSGIGYDAVRHFIEIGYHVFGSVRTDEDADRLRANFPSNFTCIKFDVTRPDEVDSARKIVADILDGNMLTALVNNAGYALGGPMAMLSTDAFRKQFEVNVVGVREVTNAFLPLLGASLDYAGPRAKIINISSISGIVNTPMNGAYCVTKHALESMTEVYRRELCLYGIQLSTIQPGPIQSHLWEKNMRTMDQYLSTDYGVIAKNTAGIIRQAQREAQHPEVISSLIEEIINSKRPKLSYIVTRRKLANYLFAKLIPRRIVDWILYRVLHRA